MRDPGNVPRRERAASALRRIIAAVKSKAVAGYYDGNARLLVPRGIIYQGELNLLEAGLLLLEEDPEIARDFHERSRLLADALAQRPHRLAESYPGATYPVDNVAALHSLVLHDALYQTGYRSQIVAPCFAHLAAVADKRTGCMPSRVSVDQGAALWEPRGCSESMAIARIASFDPAWAREEYARYQKAFGTRIFGAAAFREWRRGVEKAGDVDSGPIVMGAGAAASGFGLGAAHAVGDRQTFGELLVLADGVGQPQVTSGKRSYLGGALVLGDVLTAWGKTTAVWRPLH